MEYSCTTVRDTYGPICHVVKDRDKYLFRMIDRDEAEQLVNMLNELARLRDATRWRSVGEELPEESGNYATWHPGEMPYARMYWADVRRFEGPTPTHWQPLPAPPGEEE